jgi:uncharacterized protein YhjY with autotransporter beta-barrel domain
MKLFWGSIVFGAVACFAPLAFGQATSNWINITDNSTTNQSGNFNDSTKWDNGVPNANTAASISVFNLLTTTGGNVINIAVPAGQSASALQTSDEFPGFFQGTINLNIATGATLNITGNFPLATDTLIVNQGVITNINGGAINIASGNTVVGDTSGFTNTLNYSQTSVVYGNNVIDAVGSGLLVSGTLTGGEVGVTKQNQTSITTGSGFQLQLGVDTGTFGSYSLTNQSSLNLGLSGTIFIGASGSSFNEDATSTVSLGAGSKIDVGTTGGDNAVFNMAGNLTMNGTINVGAFGSNGTFNQTGGNLTGSSILYLGGNSGTGVYNLSGGNATFSQGLSVGQRIQLGTGIFNQSGNSSMTTSGTIAQIGTLGVGYYNLSGGGTVDFQAGLTIGNQGHFDQSGNTTFSSEGSSTISPAGTFTITGGTATFNNGLTLDGTLSINGGILSVGRDQLLGAGMGTINLGGGTLRLTGGSSSTYVYNFGGLLTGGTSTIDVSSTPTGLFSFASALTGAPGAGINLIGNGSTIFDFASITTPGVNNTYTGSTGISNGALNATQNDIALSNALILGSGGALNLGLNSGGMTYGGTISGPGSLLLNFTTAGDTFAMPNANGFSGAIVVGANGTAGNLQIYNGTYSNISDNGTGSSVTIGGTPSTGGSVPSSGTVILPGANAYTGTTTINPGFNVLASNFNGNVVNGGTLGNLGFPLHTSPINGSVGQMTIAGNLNSTGVINVFTDGQTADTFKVNGATTSTLSGVVNTIGSGTGKYAVVTTGPGLLAIGGNGNLNDPNGLNTEAPLTLFSTYLTSTSGTLFVNTIQKPMIGFATTPAERAVANNLDPLTQTPPKSFAPLLLIFNGLPADQIGPNLQALSPINFQYNRTIVFENSTFMVQKLNGVLSSLRSGYDGLDTSGVSFSSPGETGLGQSLRSMLASNAPDFHTTAPNGVNYYPDDGSSAAPAPSSIMEPTSSPSRMTPADAASPTSYNGQVMSDSPIPMRTSAPPTLRTSRFSEFVAGDVVLADINQNQDTLSKASYTAGDIAAGVSFRMTSNLSVGVLFDFNHTNAKTDGNGSTTQVNTFAPGVYATFFEKGFYANGLFSFGVNQYNTSNVIPLGGQGGTANSSTSGEQYVANLDLGYDFRPAKGWVVGPTAGITYTHMDIDSFSESGVPLVDLNVNSQSADSLRSRLGGHIEYLTSVGDIILQPNVTAMWQHEYITDNAGITANFQNLPTGSFLTPLSTPAQDSALLGCGLTATLNNSMAFYLNYLADVSDDYLAQSIIVGVKASF